VLYIRICHDQQSLEFSSGSPVAKVYPDHARQRIKRYKYPALQHVCAGNKSGKLDKKIKDKLNNFTPAFHESPQHCTGRNNKMII
jgi:hypothetical protein